MLPGGYPPLVEYERLESDPGFRDLERFATDFVGRNHDALAYYRRRWVADPIRNWSRRWEYLFVYERIAAALLGGGARATRLLDAGSGLTFFPHFIAARNPGTRIECGDRDARVVIDARGLGPPASESVRYSVQDIEDLSHPDGAFDGIACVSVIEHCRDPEAIVAELGRVLRPGGVLALTIDVAPGGDAEIPIDRAAALIELLSGRFVPDEDYAAGVRGFDPLIHLTTDHARRADPSRLPWAPPRFHLLTCFCMSLRAPIR